MADKKRLLFILPFLPWPLKSGGHQAIYNGILAVKDELEVYVTYMLGRNDDDESDLACLKGRMEGVRFFPYRNKDKSVAYLCRVLHRRIRYFLFPSSSNIFHYMPRMEIHPSGYVNHINGLIENNQIDIVQVEMYKPCSLVHVLSSKARKVFVNHELRFVRNELYLSSLGETPRRRASVEEGKKLEISMMNAYDAVITLSETDKGKLMQNGVSVPVFSSFSVVNLNNAKIPDDICGTELSFLGPEEHNPNYVGLLWFLTNCWERLLDMNPDYHLRIIGKWSSGTSEALMSRYRNLRFCGFVDQLEDELSGTVMIVPITIGSGIRMKIIEASNLGVPVVSTSVGIEGLGFTDGKDCLIADTPEDFVMSVRKISDPGFREKVIAAARSHISFFSMDSLRKNRIDIYEAILGQKV